MKKITVVLKMSDPIKRQDPFIESLSCWNDIADEILIYTGLTMDYLREVSGLGLHQARVVLTEWKEDWSYQDIVKMANDSIQVAVGDFLIAPDLDWFIHEKDWNELKSDIIKCDEPLIVLQKYNVITEGDYYQKTEEKCIFNLKFKDRICLGIDKEGKSEVNTYVWKDDNKYNGVPSGRIVREVQRSGVTLWNFDSIFRTKEVVKREIWALSKAKKKLHSISKWGQSEEEAWNFFLDMMRIRKKKCIYKIDDLNVIPKYIRDKYKSLRPEQFGFNGWGLI